MAGSGFFVQLPHPGGKDKAWSSYPGGHTRKFMQPRVVQFRPQVLI